MSKGLSPEFVGLSPFCLRLVSIGRRSRTYFEKLSGISVTRRCDMWFIHSVLLVFTRSWRIVLGAMSRTCVPADIVTES